MIRMRFNLDLSAVRKRIGQKVVVAQKKIAFNLLDGIVNMTPVDTGRARGNWLVSLGSPDLSFRWDTKDSGGGSTIAAGSTKIQELQTYGAIYITNNLPYIVALEKGRSGQAPVGMVQVSLDRVAAGLG